MTSDEQRLTLRMIFFGRGLDRLSPRRRLRFDLVGIVLVLLLVVVLDAVFNGRVSSVVLFVLGSVFTVRAVIRYWLAWPP